MNEDQMRYIEFWENEYLNQIYYLMNIDKEKMLSGFDTKEDIRGDWERFLGAETSDFATGSERIFYWLFSQFGVPNSSPIGSDMFFETYNAYVHIDIKTVTLSNIGDFKRNIFVGDNQNSYIGNINVRGKESRPYRGNLPMFYTKRNGSQKVCLTYFIVILYDETNLDIQTIAITCMPNGGLNRVYGDNVISPGKNPGKIRFNYAQIKYFELLERKPMRTKVLLWNKNMRPEVQIAMRELYDIYLTQNDNN